MHKSEPFRVRQGAEHLHVRAHIVKLTRKHASSIGHEATAAATVSPTPTLL